MINWIKSTLKALVQYLVYLFFFICFLYFIFTPDINMMFSLNLIKKIFSSIHIKNLIAYIYVFPYHFLFFILPPFIFFKLTKKYHFTLKRHFLIAISFIIFLIVYVTFYNIIKTTFPPFSVSIDKFKNNKTFKHDFKIRHSEEKIYEFYFYLEKSINKSYAEIKKEFQSKGNVHIFPYEISLYKIENNKEIVLKKHSIEIDFSKIKLYPSLKYPFTKRFYYKLKKGKYFIKINKKNSKHSSLKLTKFGISRKTSFYESYGFYKVNHDKQMEYILKGEKLKKDVISLLDKKRIKFNVEIENTFFFNINPKIDHYYFMYKKFGKNSYLFKEKTRNDLKAYFKPYLINNIYYFPYKIIIYKNTKKKEKIYETVDIKIDFTTKETFLNSRNIFDINLEKGNYLIDVIKTTDKEPFLPLYAINIKERNDN